MSTRDCIVIIMTSLLTIIHKGYVHMTSALKGREGVRQFLTKGRLREFGSDKGEGEGPKI